jgi:hypothetical protein
MPLIYSRYDPRRTDTRLYKGGGDGGAEQMRKDEEERQRKVQAAVDAINAKFGQGGGGAAGPAPDREQFTKHTPGGVRYVGMGGSVDAELQRVDDPETTVFDEAGYNAALQQFQQGQNAQGAKSQREAMYSDIAGAVRDTAMRDLDRQYETASKRNTFGLARAGQLGGSVDAESGGELSTLYGEGKLKAEQAGQQAGSDLRVTDEKTRQALIGLAQSGLDTGTAASLAEQQMGAAADLSKSQAAGASVGRIFDDMSQAYVANQLTKARAPVNPQGQPAGYSYGGFTPSRYTGTIGR